LDCKSIVDELLIILNQYNHSKSIIIKLLVNMAEKTVDDDEE